MIIVSSDSNSKISNAAQDDEYELVFSDVFNLPDGSYDVMIPDVNKVYETRFDWIRVYQKR